ncbi:MAG: ABC transporter ATP-binding protein, partial [Wenzhouxiangella sp.]|nr:ABC transporter ATP-binding protein [Wenzhouxiangella sp.]
ILWASAPGWTVASTFLLVLEIILGLATLYLIKTLVDAITSQVSGSPDLAAGINETTQSITETMATSPNLTAFEPILWQVGLFAAATLGYLAVRSLSSLAREAQGLAVVDYLDRQIHQSAIQADLAFYESPKYFDTLQRARQSGTSRPAQVASNALMLIKNALMLSAVIALMISIDWRLLPILAVAILPALWVRVHFTQVLYQWKKRRTELERRAGYLDWLMTSDFHAKELRLNQLGEYLKNAYTGVKSKIRLEQLNITQSRTWVEMAVSMAAATIFFLALGYLTIQTARGQNTVGDLVLFLLIFQRAQSMGQEIVNQISKLYEDHLYLGLLFEFLDLKPQLTVIERKEEPGIRITKSELSKASPPKIEVRGVHFTYPGCEAEVLTDLNLTLNPGQVVAMVGANGSGKTSLIKLLTRLYDPSQGQILVDGVDVRSHDPEAYRRLFSVVFQDFACYADSVNNNIRFGDITVPAESDAMQKAAERAGAVDFVEALPHGFDTMLGRMFEGGVDLSRGQWQKIALARAFMERAKVIVLDEPSSALDPNAEADLFENFKERLDGRSALLIAHRLSTIRLADWIYVLDEGRIVEEGSHEMLAGQEGMYAQAFARQGRFYAG